MAEGKDKFLADFISDAMQLGAPASLKEVYDAGTANRLSDSYLLQQAIECGKKSNKMHLWYLVALNWWTWVSYDPNSPQENPYRFYNCDMPKALDDIGISLNKVNALAYEKAKRNISGMMDKARLEYGTQAAKAASS